MSIGLSLVLLGPAISSLSSVPLVSLVSVGSLLSGVVSVGVGRVGIE